MRMASKLKRQEYQKPETNIIEIEIHGMLAASPPGFGGEGGSRELEDLLNDEFPEYNDWPLSL